MAHDIFDLDDRIVDENASRERNAEQADEVQRKSECAHRPESRDRSQRQRNGRDQRRAHVAQEQEHDQHGERRAFDQRFHGSNVVAARIGDGIVDLRQLYIRVLGLELLEGLVHRIGNRKLARSFHAENRERHDRLAVEPAERPLFAGVIDDATEILEAHLAAAAENDFGVCQRTDLPGSRQHADRLLLAADLAAAGAEIDVGRADLAVHLRGRDAVSQKLFGIEIDADLAIDAAIAFDTPDALRRLQTSLDDIIDVPRELFERHAWRCGRIGQDRLAFDVDALDNRLIDRARQISASSSRSHP